VVVIAAPAGLLYKNLPAIRANDGSMLREFVRSATSGLPEHGVIAFATIHTSTAWSRRTCGKREGREHARGQHTTDAVRRLPEGASQAVPQRWPALPAVDPPINYLNPFI